MSCKRILESQDIDNEQKLVKLASDVELTSIIKSILTEGEVFSSYKTIPEHAVLQLTIEGKGPDQSGFELVKDDVKEVNQDYGKIFSKYGPIKDIQVWARQGYITYESQISAMMAKKALHLYNIAELEVTFKLQFVEASLVNNTGSSLSELQSEDQSVQNGAEDQNSTNAGMFMKPSSKVDITLPQKQASAALPSSKLTCRYDIQIDNDRDFQVAKKIIGAKGCNMKQIIDGTLYGTLYDPLKENDLVKLRLRGKGSGFKEGPAKRGRSGSPQSPMNLCIYA